MLGFIFQYNGVTINDSTTFSFTETNKAYASITDVMGFSGDSLQHTEASPIDTHGIIDYPSFMKGRLVTIRGGVVGQTEADCVALCNKISGAFSIPLSPSHRTDGYRELIFRDWKNPDLKYMCMAKPYKLVEFTKEMHIGRLRKFEIQLRMESPYVYTAGETIVPTDNMVRERVVKTPIMTDTGPRVHFDAVNSGQAEVYLRYRVTGAFNGLTVHNHTAGTKQKVINLGLEPNGYLAVDGMNGTAIANGQSVVNQFSSDSNWLSLKSGSNEISFDFGTMVSPLGEVSLPEIEVAYRTIYLTII